MRDDGNGTDEERDTPDKTKTVPTREKGKEPEPPATDGWRPPASLNPWARAFDGDSLPDEPYMGSNKKPKQLSDMLPYPNPASAGATDDKPRPTLEGMR